MTRRNLAVSNGSDIPGGLKITQGGTGASSAVEALVNLGGVPANTIDEAGGPIPLNTEGLPDFSIFSGISVIDSAIDGDRVISVRETKEYFITTYDAFTDYVIEAVDGEVEVDRHVIRYTAPYRAGSSGFKVNGRLFSVAVTGTRIGQPEITSPIEGVLNRPLSLSVLASPFTYSGDEDYHFSSDWEVATDPDFENITQSSYKDAFHLTFWEIMALKELTTHYVRTRYRSNNGSVSPWSPPRSFKTGNDGVINNENQVIPNPTGQVNEHFGWCGIYDGTGTRLFITASKKDDETLTDAGCVYIYTKNTEGFWVYQQTLVSPTPSVYEEFGDAIAVSDDGVHLVVGAQGYNPGDNKGYSGRAYYFTRSGEVWTHRQTLYPPAPDNDLRFSYFKITLSTDGTELIIGAMGRDSGVDYYRGAWYHYSRTGNTWTLLNTYVTSQPVTVNNGRTGHFSVMSDDKQHLLVSTPGSSYDSFGFQGYVEHYTKSGNNWVYTGVIKNPTPVADEVFGHNFAINSDASVLLVGAVVHPNAYVFTRSGNIWTYQTSLKPAGLPDIVATYGIRTAMSKDGTTLYVGHPSVTEPGKVHMYQKVGGVWTNVKTFTRMGGYNGDVFGRSIIALNPVAQELAIASTGEGGNAGLVHIFS